MIIFKQLLMLIIATLLEIQEIESQYLITLMEVEVLVKNDTKFSNIDKTSIKRTNRNEPHKLWIEMEIFRFPKDNIFLIWGQLYKKQGYEYRLTPYKIKGHMCDFLENDPSFYPSIRAQGNFPDVCPFPPGKYYLNGYYPNMTNLPAVMASGDYMAEVKLYESEEYKEVLQGMRIYASLINKVGGMIGLK